MTSASTVGAPRALKVGDTVITSADVEKHFYDNMETTVLKFHGTSRITVRLTQGPVAGTDKEKQAFQSSKLALKDSQKRIATVPVVGSKPTSGAANVATSPASPAASSSNGKAADELLADNGFGNVMVQATVHP